LAKAWSVAEHMKGITPTQNSQEGFARTLFNCAIEMSHGLDGANSVLRAAMAIGTAK
jgi:hypothetical protein